HPELGPARSERLRHGAGGAEVGALGLLDDRQDHVGLPAPTALTVDELQHALALPADAYRGADRAAARWPVLEGGDVEVAVQREREGAWDGSRGEQEHVGSRSLS